MVNRLAIHANPSAKGKSGNVFGITVANRDLYRAMLTLAGMEHVDFVSETPGQPGDIVASLGLEGVVHADVQSASLLDQERIARAGALLRGGPRIDEFAWQRRRAVGDRAYSLIGMIHTLAPPAIRADMATQTLAPIQPWDALICTSPSVQSALKRMFDDWDRHLVERLGATRCPRPKLPLIPLAVDGEKFARSADRGDLRSALRTRLALGSQDILVLWVGRLSFFEKAFPQPMMRAVAEAARSSGVQVHFAMAGWFPNPQANGAAYREAASAYAPDIGFSVIDGNDPDCVAEAWAAADIFLSLVDNIQETFGITPLEAMASGVPVVVSDWDGYRYTVVDGEQGFLVPTLGGPPQSLPDDLIAGHALGIKSYQQYVGAVAQHTAVDVGAAAEAIAVLIASPDLRRRMGEAGRRRIAEEFDWTVVAPKYAALIDELKDIRNACVETAPKTVRHPAKGDPFRDFAGFATEVLSMDHVLSLRSDGRKDLLRSSQLELDMFAGNWRGTIDEAEVVVDALSQGPAKVRDLLLRFPMPRRRRMQLTLMWMCKLGILAWRLPGAEPYA